jgi:hypothetical protein
MTRLEALRSLETKVVAGDMLAMDLISVFAMNPTDAAALKHGSLAAAKSLHEAVVHERVVVKANWSKRYGGKFVLKDHTGEWVGQGDDNLARAWLLAIIRLLIAMEEIK